MPVKINKAVNTLLKQDNSVTHIISLCVSSTLRGVGMKVRIYKVKKRVKEKEVEVKKN